MINNELVRHLNELLSVVQKFAKAKIDLLKLSLIDKSSGFTSFIFSLLFAVLVAAMTVGFCAAAFAVWYGQQFGSYVGGLLIAAGSLLVLSFVFFLIGRRLLVSIVIKNFADILFDDDDKQEI